MNKTWFPGERSALQAAANPFDILLRAQKFVDTIDNPLEQDEEMRKYLLLVEGMIEQERELLQNLTVSSEVAMLEIAPTLDNPDQRTGVSFVEHVGIVGNLLGVGYSARLAPEIGKLATGYTLNINAHHIFSFDRPADNGDDIHNAARIPIQAVRYIDYGNAN